MKTVVVQLREESDFGPSIRILGEQLLNKADKTDIDKL